MAQKVTTGVYKGVTTSELDELAAETAASMTATHPDYAVVGVGPDVTYSKHISSTCSLAGPCLVNRSEPADSQLV